MVVFGEVFLMGLVTEREAKAAADIASRVSGVKRVTTAYAGVLGSAIIPGERPYCRRLVY